VDDPQPASFLPLCQLLRHVSPRTLSKHKRFRANGGVVGVAADATFSSILSHACLALTACDGSSGAVVGAIALFPCPPFSSVLPADPNSPALDTWLANRCLSLSISLPSGLITPLLLVDPDQEEEALLAMLLKALELCPSLNHLLFASEAPTPLSQPHLASRFLPSSGPPGLNGAALSLATRAALRPALVVRLAVVEDHDELLPLVEAAAERYGALGQVIHASHLFSFILHAWQHCSMHISILVMSACSSVVHAHVRTASRCNEVMPKYEAITSCRNV
jgi:hypothetical protein